MATTKRRLPLEEVLLLGHAALAAVAGEKRPSAAVAIQRIANYVKAFEGWEEFIRASPHSDQRISAAEIKKLSELEKIHAEVLSGAVTLLNATKRELGESRTRGKSLKAYVKGASHAGHLPGRQRSRKKL